MCDNKSIQTFELRLSIGTSKDIGHRRIIIMIYVPIIADNSDYITIIYTLQCTTTKDPFSTLLPKKESV